MARGDGGRPGAEQFERARSQGCALERGRPPSCALSTDPRLPHTLGRSLLALAELATEQGHLEEAWGLAHDGLRVLSDHDDRVGAAAALETLADLAVAGGEPERALRLLAASQRHI